MARKKKKKEPIPVNKKVEKLIEIYKEAEKKLIEIITNKEIKGNATTFYKDMLNQVQQEILRLQIYNTQWATDITKQLYEQAYKEAIEMLEIPQESFTQLHKDAIDVIADNTINNLNQATNLVGRQIEDNIRQIGLSSAANKFATGQTIREMQKQLAIKLLDEGLTAIKDKRGHNISLSSYSEMLARSIVAETQNTCVKNVMKEHGKDLVKMTEHFTSCPLCATYEGRVYSISGKDKRFPALKSVPGFSSGYNNIHPRCRHRITPYIEKYQDVDEDKEYSNRPFEVDKEKEESVNQYFKEQKEKTRLRNDRKQYEKYRQVLGDLAPKNFASFRRIKYNNSNRWQEIKSDYKIVNFYNVIEGEVSPSKIIELHNLDKEVRNEFTGSLKKDGNIAVMEFENNIYLSHSRIQNKDNKGFRKYKGNKTMVLLDKNREFKYLIVPKESGWSRHVDTEAKLFEYLNKINIDKNKKQAVFFITEKPMCESCKYVMNQFKKINKNITLNIIEGRVN